MGKIIHVIEAANHEEFKHAVTELHSMVCLPARAILSQAANVASKDADVPNPPSDQQPEPGKKRGRKPGSTKEAVAKEVIPEVVKDAPEAIHIEEVEEKSVISASAIKQEAVAATQVDPFSEEVAAAPLQPQKLTFELIRDSLHKVNEKHGIDTVRKILADLGVQKVTAIKEADYASAWKLISAEL